ncbi:MAG: hypothetical protein B1H08_01385 [Candidatus Omnitrophica bacterium 4484_171]|nr:MAG: hypothetical protein B1H08_01385 [Candidatus Omnitrophica bacterium 4484_171]
MAFIKGFIEILWVTISFKVLRKPRDEITSNIENITTASFIIKWILHIFLLGLYWSLHPYFPMVVVIFIILQIVTGLWLLFNKENYLSTFEKIPEIVNKIFPLAYLIYFGYNFLSFIIF